MNKLLKEYRVELIALVCALLGVFLLVEQLEIRATIIRATRGILTRVGQIADRIIGVLVYEATHITVSDAMGLVLIGVAFVVLVWRMRYRLRRSPNYAGATCPLCGGSLHRTRRTLLDHLIDRFAPVQRYRCENPQCGWAGLRVKPL